VKRLLVAGALGYLLLDRFWRFNRRLMVENAEGLGELLPH
jgi:hypothetical protein